MSTPALKPPGDSENAGWIEAIKSAAKDTRKFKSLKPTIDQQIKDAYRRGVQAGREQERYERQLSDELSNPKLRPRA